MTAYRTVTLICDDPSACVATFTPRHPYRTARDVRHHARCQGWTREGRGDRCPKHSPSGVSQEGGKP